MSGAAAGFEPKNVLATPKTKTTKAGDTVCVAEVSWTTEKPGMGVVEFGTTPASLLLRRAESQETTDHRVILPDTGDDSKLKCATSYHFRIRVGEEVFDNGGIPYSFKTKEVATKIIEEESPKVTVVPTIVGTDNCGAKIDYNKDGAVNSLDYAACKKGSGGTSQGGGSQCSREVDYNKDGVVNSLDLMSCLQNAKK